VKGRPSPLTTELQPVEIVDRPATLIVGVARDFTMETRHTIPVLWSTFFEGGYDIPDQADAAMYGVSFNQDGAGGFRYGVGMAVEKAPDEMAEGLCTMELSAGPHAVLRAFGPVTELPQQFDRMFSSWLPSSNYEIRIGAVFERYPQDARNNREAMAYEIWVPVSD